MNNQPSTLQPGSTQDSEVKAAPGEAVLKPLVATVRASPGRRFWEVLGGTSLTISVIVHLLLIVVGVLIVFETIQEPEKKVDFMPSAGGGGSSASEEISQKQRVKMLQPNMARVVALGTVSNLVLPEPDEQSQMASLGSISSGGLSGGLGGAGTGGGKGAGTGPGIGSGFGLGMGEGTGVKNPFGMLGGKGGALKGSFYDLKQTRDRKPTNMTDVEFHSKVTELVNRGFKESLLRDYYKAPRELTQTSLHIPIIPADQAPAAFECENEVQPRQWLVVYRGAVQAPKSGKFRFVGAADDVLVVRFNRRNVFDFGYTLASIGTQFVGRSGELDGTTPNADLAKKMRRSSPMELPIRFYRYQQTPTFNQGIGGYAVGPVFQVQAGRVYPIEIVIGEIPGGFFGGSLLIEEIGATYQKDPSGSPILPLFRLDSTRPNESMQGEFPPTDPNGPVWKFVPGSDVSEI